MNKLNDQNKNKSEPSSASKEWHPNAPMNPNAAAAQPQPMSTPDPSSAELIPPVLESDDSIEHQWRAGDSKVTDEDEDRH